MKVQIRQGVFETNSSSVHSLTMVSGEDYQAWKDGKLVMDSWTDKLVVADETTTDTDKYKTYDEYWDNMDMESFEQTHTTKSGEKVIAFGYYGNNG